MGLKKEIAIIGLGKMGKGLALNLIDHDWRVVGYNRSPEATRKLEAEGNGNFVGTYSVKEMVARLTPTRLVWLMLPAGQAVTEVLFGENGLVRNLKKGDVIIDGGNSFYQNTITRAAKLAGAGLGFLDVGVSGGPTGARSGACLMIGGDHRLYQTHEELFADLAVKNGYGYLGRSGAGHFVKMVHNGIEYGMIQAIAEGFDLLHQTPEFELDLFKIAQVYNHGSVITSRLIGWLKDAYQKFGQDLNKVPGSAAESGEGAWTVETATKLGVPVQVIETALQARRASQQTPNYQGRITQALRNTFGGHPIKPGR